MVIIITQGALLGSIDGHLYMKMHECRSGENEPTTHLVIY